MKFSAGCVIAALTFGILIAPGQADVLTPEWAQARAAYNELGDLAAGGDQGSVLHLLSAAESEDKFIASSALNNLGWLAWNGKGVEKDQETGAEYYRKSAAMGNAVGAYSYGNMVRKGYGRKGPDPVTALYYYQKAAQWGHVNGALSAGDLLSETSAEIRSDPAYAVAYYELALAMNPDGKQRDRAEDGLSKQRSRLRNEDSVPFLGENIRKTAEQLRSGTYGLSPVSPPPAPAPRPAPPPPPQSSPKPDIRPDVMANGRACMSRRDNLVPWKKEIDAARRDLKEWASDIREREKRLNVEYNLDVARNPSRYPDYKRRENALNADKRDYNSDNRTVRDEQNRYNNAFDEYKNACSFSVSRAEHDQLCNNGAYSNKWCQSFDFN